MNEAIDMNKKTAKSITLHKEVEQLFVNLIHRRLGIVIHKNQMADLRKIIADGCNKYHVNPEGYLQLLSTCSEQSPILDELISAVTIGETYFFRDKSQMELLKNIILPMLISDKRKEGNLSLRVWSAGCASGEEIYTIAILLYGLLKDIEQWRINLLGTDINTRALKQAINGRYNKWSMRSISEYYKSQFFTQDGQQYLINENIKQMVKFDYLNLNDSDYPSINNGTNAQDLIICRNVLIYFDRNHVNQLMKRISASMNEHGVLILGASDPINIEETDLKFNHNLGIVFTKVKPAEAPKQSIEVKASHPPVTRLITPKFKISTNASKEQKPREALMEPIVTNETINSLMGGEKWDEVVTIINKYKLLKAPSATLLNSQAIALANLGRLEEARSTLEESLALDKTNKDTYYYYAMTLNELNKIAQAQDALKTTLFLDREFVIGHYQLGLLLLREKKFTQGVKCLRNALTIVQQRSPKNIVDGPQQITNEKLIEILKREIELYSEMNGEVNGHAS